MPSKILIVDDEPPIVTALQFLLTQKGYQVMVAYDGEEAIESIMKFSPDLVLLDIMLPGIDGYEVCEIVRLNPEWRNIRIIFLTAKGRQEDIAKGLVLGADAYVTKPFANAQILAKIEEVLESRL